MNLGDWNGAEAWESSTRGVWLSDGKGEDDKGGHMHPLGYVKVVFAVSAVTDCGGGSVYLLLCA